MMRAVVIYLLVVIVVASGSPLFGSDDSTETTETPQEEPTTVEPSAQQGSSSESDESSETTVAYRQRVEPEEDESRRENQEDDQSIPETTVIYATEESRSEDERQQEEVEPSTEATVSLEEGSRTEDHESITEETTVIEETPAPVDQDARVEVAQRIDVPVEEEEEGRSTEEPEEATEVPLITEGTTGHPPELPTAMAQMMGQLEIRLIDENNTQTHVESVIQPPPLSPITPYATHHDGDDGHQTTPMTSGDDDHVSTPDPEYDAKWKKVEYVSDAVINLEEVTTTEPVEIKDQRDEETTTQEEEEEVPTSTPDASLPPAIVDTTPEAVETTTLSPIDQVALAKIQSAYDLGLAKKMPEGPFPDAVTDDDLPVLEGVNVDDEDDDPEPVEECLANKHQLSEEVVHRMEKQVERLSKMVRKLGKQQSQYCTTSADENTERQLFTDTYSQCPIWREEKIVHYYKLMRITYCADYGKWPNREKMMKTYGQYLPLFETLYAFQKQ